MMLAFFGHPKLSVRLYAFLGGGVLLCYSSYMAWFALQLVEWRGAFFDMLEQCGAKAPECSGEINPVYALLLRFLLIVLPAIIISCVVNWHRKVYLVTWRCDITRSYYRKWKELGCPQIEGAAQRMQEDTGKFVWDIEGIVTDLLDAFMSLLIFTPKILEIGAEVPPPPTVPLVSLAFGSGRWWLFRLAATAALAGWLGSAALTRRTVDLEIDKQKQEAQARRLLVLREAFGFAAIPTRESRATRGSGGGSTRTTGGTGTDHAAVRPSRASRVPSGTALTRFSESAVRNLTIRLSRRPSRQADEEAADDSDAESAEEDDDNNKGDADDIADVLHSFMSLEPESRDKVKALEELSLKGTIEMVAASTRELAKHMFFFQAWSSSFDYVVGIVPYALMAPLFFPEPLITIGSFMQLSNTFEKVFNNLSLPAMQWGRFNDLRSVLRRLMEFELCLLEASASAPGSAEAKVTGDAAASEPGGVGGAGTASDGAQSDAEGKGLERADLVRSWESGKWKAEPAGPKRLEPKHRAVAKDGANPSSVLHGQAPNSAESEEVAALRLVIARMSQVVGGPDADDPLERQLWLLAAERAAYRHELHHKMRVAGSVLTFMNKARFFATHHDEHVAADDDRLEALPGLGALRRISANPPGPLPLSSAPAGAGRASASSKPNAGGDGSSSTRF